MKSLWIVGVLLALIGSVISNLGQHIQKHTLSSHRHAVYYRQPGWLCGLLLVILGSVCDFAALGLAAQSIVAPLSTITLISNLIFGYYWSHEELQRRELWATACILGGSLLTVCFGNHSTQAHTMGDILALWIAPGFIIFFILLLIVQATVYCCIVWIAELEEWQSRHTVPVPGLEDDGAHRYHQQALRKWRPHHPFLLCTLSGTLSAQSFLVGKMIMAAIVASIEHERTFEVLNVFFFAFLLWLLVSIGGQIHFFTRALQRYDALLVVPVFQSALLITSTAAAAAFFQEFQQFDALHACLVVLGLLCILLGVRILGQRKVVLQELRQQFIVQEPLDGVDLNERSVSLDDVSAIPHA